MTSYLISFSVYTLAMIGVILLGFVVAQKSLAGGFIQNKAGFLTLEQTLCLEPRRSIYLVRAGNERFLVSTDAQGTKFLTKLDENNVPLVQNEDSQEAKIFDFNKKYNLDKQSVISLFEKVSSYATNLKIAGKR